jgi:protein-disulfide isomerase
MVTGDSPSLGPKDAKVTVVEFSDFQCPHCRAFADNLKSLESKYPQVRWVFKNYPLEKIHPWAMEAAIAARCAYLSSNDAFWKISASIFGSQDTLTADNAGEQFRTAAIVAGVPADAYVACIANPTTKVAIEADIKQGKAVDVESTPTVFVNGRPAIGGEPQQVSGSIDYELARAATPGPPRH